MRYVLYALAVLAAVIAFMVYRTVRFTKKDGRICLRWILQTGYRIRRSRIILPR